MRERALNLKRKTREELIAGQRAEQPGWSDAELEPWGMRNSDSARTS